jgi:hypothetical protein
MSESESSISNSLETISPSSEIICPSPETIPLSPETNSFHVEKTFIDLVIKSLENEIITTPDPITSLLDLSSNIIEQTFIDLVIKYLENENMKKKIFIALTPEITSVIKNIISLSPDTLTDIEKAMIETIKDGKIDVKDIPNIIVVIQRIYQFIYSLKDTKFDAKKRADITSTLLKYILHILVLERKIKIDEDKQTEFVIQMYYLIDSCVGLLSYSKSLKTKSCFKMFR